MELWLVLVQPVLEWHVAFIVSHFCQYSGGWRWACTVLWRHGVLACASKSYMCFLLSLWSWASLLASLSLSPPHVKHEDTLSNREDSVRCKCTALIASHRETPPGKFRASHFLPLLSSFTNFSLHPFLWDSARLETTEGWTCSDSSMLQRRPPPQPEVKGVSAIENCPVHCMLFFFCPCCTLLQTLSTDGLFLLQFSMWLCMGEVGITQPSLIVDTLVLSFDSL